MFSSCRTQPDAILRRDDQARLVRPVGAAAVPQRSLGDRQRSRRHGQLDGVRPVAVFMIGLIGEVRRLHRALDILSVPEMASRNDFGGAVLFGRIVDRPERADAKRGPWPRHLGAAVVEVPGLHGLAGMQVDREQRRQQATLAEFGFDKGQGERMDRELGEDRRFRQQRIDPVGLGAFKIVAAEQIARQMRRQRRADFGDAIGLKDASRRSGSRDGRTLPARRRMIVPRARVMLAPLSLPSALSLASPVRPGFLAPSYAIDERFSRDFCERRAATANSRSRRERCSGTCSLARPASGSGRA